MWNNEIYVGNGTVTQTTVVEVQSVDHVRAYNYILDTETVVDGTIDIASGLYIRKVQGTYLEDLIYNNEFILSDVNTITFNEVIYNPSELYLVIEDNEVGFGDLISDDPSRDEVFVNISAEFAEFGNMDLSTLPVYADEAAAVIGALVTGNVYRTATGELRIKL